MQNSLLADDILCQHGWKYVSYPAKAQIDQIWDVELPDKCVMPSGMICTLCKLAADTPSRSELDKSKRAPTIALATDFASDMT